MKQAGSASPADAGKRDVRLIQPSDRDDNTAQTPGLRRETAIDGKLVGARNFWMGFARIDPGASSAPHHHGRSESGVYLLRGACRFRFGENLEQVVDAQKGDFVYVPPYAIHDEVNLSSEEPVEFVVVRGSSENIAVPAGR
ncbi:MAG: cupin domain-containing protein [Thermoplasmata archaeon]